MNNIRLPRSGVNSEAGVMMKQSTVGKHVLDQIFYTADKAKPSLQTCPNICYSNTNKSRNKETGETSPLSKTPLKKQMLLI